MISKFRQWYMTNYDAITWFLIGWLCFGGLLEFARGDYVSAIFYLGIAFVNYIFVKR